MKKIIPPFVFLSLLGVLGWLGWNFRNLSFTKTPQEARVAGISMDRFDRWLKTYPPGNARRGVDAKVREGVELARARKKDMLIWMREDPEGALRRMISRTVYPTLPEEIRQHVEQPIDLVAPYSVAVACQGMPRTERVLTIGEQDLPVHTYGHRLGIGSKNYLPVHGFILEGEVAMDASPVRVADPRESAVPDPFPNGRWCWIWAAGSRRWPIRRRCANGKNNCRPWKDCRIPTFPVRWRPRGGARPDPFRRRILRWPRIGPTGPKRS